MEFAELKAGAQGRLEPAAWAYYQGTADSAAGHDRDENAWQQLDLVPRVLTGLSSVDTGLQLGGVRLATPVMVAATAAHRLADPEGEIGTARAAAAVGALMTYSGSAAIEVTEFGRAATGAWWAQVYLMKDRGLTRDYLDRLTAAGAAAVVLTVDNPGTLGDAPFRIVSRAAHIVAQPGNFPGLTWQQMSAQIEPELTVDHIAELARATGLPVYVKGIVHPADAAAVASVGAAGLVVSNHGRRQLAGVIPTAVALPGVVRAVAGRVPVLVDGGVRSGIDVLRALALGAAAVGLGRPVLWGLSAAGAAGVEAVLAGITAELQQAMAAVGAATLADLTPDLVRVSPPGA